MMKKTIFLILAAYLISASIPGRAADREEGEARKGVVLILADDLSAHLACMGTPGIKTPSADALAKEGVMFTRAFSSCASCSPSRSSILTGMYPHSNGHWRNTFAPRLDAPDREFTKEAEKPYDHIGVHESIPTLTEVLNPLGVYTGMTTKFHLSPSWKYQFQGRTRTGSGPEDYYEMTRELLAMAGDRPYYIQVNISTPHRPFGNHLRHHQGKMPALEEIEVPPCYADTEEMRKDLQKYYGCVEVADQCASGVIRALKEMGEFENALIIFTADQGMAYHRAKASPYYAGTHIPMIIKGPDLQDNMRNNELVSLIDLMPTVLDHLGVDIPGNVQGKSLMPILRGEAEELEDRDYIYMEHNSHGPDTNEFYPSRAVFDGRYYYIQNLYPGKTYLLPADLEFFEKWGNMSFQATVNARESHPEHYRLLVELQENRPPQELYDMDSDPGQLQNLVGYGHYEEIRKALKENLESWMKETNDSILLVMGLYYDIRIIWTY
jgi:N-sulfoglucosamine sulfohydrolase